MRLTYDREANAAYLYLVEIEPGSVRDSFFVEDDLLQGSLLLQFDRMSRLVGIEKLNASQVLPEAVLEAVDDDRR